MTRRKMIGALGLGATAVALAEGRAGAASQDHARGHEGHINVMTPPPGMRGPAWAARDALLAEGLVTADDIARWDDAFTDVGQDLTGLRFFGNTYVAVGRRA